MDTQDRQLTLNDVERAGARLRDPVFVAELDGMIEQETGRRRAKLLRVSAVKTALVYNIFLLGDYFLTPDALRLSLVLHLVIVTPYIIVVASALSRVANATARESLAASIPVAMSLQIIAVYCASSSPNALHYLYFVPSAVLSLNSVQRLRLAPALSSAALIFAMLMAALLYKRAPVEIVAMHVMTYVICVGVSLNSNGQIAREQRRHFAMALRDKLRAAESDEDANHDPLTGLGNRRFLEKQAADLWSVGASADRNVTAIVFDIDRFKQFNDHYGHTQGDACLTRVAACVRAELRDCGDLAFRIGGEEFLVLLPHVELETAIGVAERIRRTIEGMGIPHEQAQGGVVTASFGVACAQVGACSVETLIETADRALYAAKRGGRNRTRSCKWAAKAGEKAA